MKNRNWCVLHTCVTRFVLTTVLVLYCTVYLALASSCGSKWVTYVEAKMRTLMCYIWHHDNAVAKLSSSWDETDHSDAKETAPLSHEHSYIPTSPQHQLPSDATHTDNNNLEVEPSPYGSTSIVRKHNVCSRTAWLWYVNDWICQGKMITMPCDMVEYAMTRTPTVYCCFLSYLKSMENLNSVLLKAR